MERQKHSTKLAPTNEMWNDSAKVIITMKKTIVVILTLGLFLGTIPFTLGFYFQSDESIRSLPKLEDDAYLAGNTVNITNPINGDLFAAGRSITIDAPIAKDVFLAAETIIINGPIGDDAKLAARSIVVNAPIADNAMMAAENVTVTYNGSIGKDARIWAGMIDVQGRLGKDASLSSGSLSLGEKASIAGNLTYTAPKANFSQEQVKGTITFNESKNRQMKGVRDFRIWGEITETLFSFIPFLLLGILALWLTPNMMAKTAKSADDFFWKNLGMGLAYLILAPTVIFLVLITIIGIPIALLAATVYTLSLFLTKILTGYWIGTKLLPHNKKKSMQLASFALGLFVYYLVFAVPFVGWFAGFILFCVTIGAIMSVKKELFLTMRKKKLI